MNIQYIRLDEGVCEVLNRLAMEERRTVSDVVNEILKEYLRGRRAAAANGITQVTKPE